MAGDGVLALVFPGQGTQAVGMGYWAYERSLKARELAQKVDDSLDFSLTRLMFEGPDEVLRRTQYTQLAIFTASLMVLSALEEAFGEKQMSRVKACAGHSVGEYSALVAAHVLPLEHAVPLLKTRAEAMEAASPRDEDGHPRGTMCALLGVTVDLVRELLDKTVKNPRECCLANDNCPGQVVISGTVEGVEQVRARALEAGAKRGIMLNVSGPFHSPWMSPVESTLRERVEPLDFGEGRFPIVANVTAQPIENPRDWKHWLPQQVTHSVRWRETVNTFVDRFHVTTCLEVGPGNVLTNLGRRCTELCTFLTAEELLRA